METFFALLAISAGNWPVPGEFIAQRPVTRSFDLRLNKRLSKQLWDWWFETLSRPLWRHRNVCMRDRYSKVNVVIGFCNASIILLCVVKSVIAITVLLTHWLINIFTRIRHLSNLMAYKSCLIVHDPWSILTCEFISLYLIELVDNNRRMNNQSGQWIEYRLLYFYNEGELGVKPRKTYLSTWRALISRGVQNAGNMKWLYIQFCRCTPGT